MFDRFVGEKFDKKFFRKNFIKIYGIKNPETKYNFEKNPLGETNCGMVPKLAPKWPKWPKIAIFSLCSADFVGGKFDKKFSKKMVSKFMA